MSNIQFKGRGEPETIRSTEMRIAECEGLIELAKSNPSQAFRKAASAGHIGVIDTIHSQYKDSLDINAKSSNGHTALMWAARNNRESCAFHLLGFEGIDTTGAVELAKTAGMKRILEGDDSAGIARSTNSSSFAFPWRFGNIYAHMAKHLPAPEANVLVIGPGYERNTSPQMVELALTQPHATFHVIENSSDVCSVIRNNLRMTPSHHQELQHIFSKNNFLPDSGTDDLAKKMLSVAPQTPIGNRINLTETDVMCWVAPEQAYDAIVATHSLCHAQEQLHRAGGPPASTTSLFLFEELLASLKPNGFMYVDLHTATGIDVSAAIVEQFIDLDQYYARSELDAPVKAIKYDAFTDPIYGMSGKDNRLLLSDQVAVYQRKQTDFKGFFEDHRHLSAKDRAEKAQIAYLPPSSI